MDAATDHGMGKQLARTQQIWQARFGRDLSNVDAGQIVHNVTGFFGVLAEWARAEKAAAAADAGQGVERNNDGRAAC